MYGNHSKHIDIPEECYKSYCGRKAYYTAFSKYGIPDDDEYKQDFVCHNEHLAQII